MGLKDIEKLLKDGRTIELFRSLGQPLRQALMYCARCYEKKDHAEYKDDEDNKYHLCKSCGTHNG